jgi:hypothetical protein
MVNEMEQNYRYTLADESETDELLSGHRANATLAWDRSSKPQGPRSGSIGIVWQDHDDPRASIRPLILIANDDDVRRLCGRYAQLRSDLSPLTAWCHLLTPRFLEALDSVQKKPELAGIEAAWTGLTVAEALLLAEKPLASIRISACLATQTYAMARTNALWNHIPSADIVNRFEAANRLCRSERAPHNGESRTGRIRNSLEPLWETLIGMGRGRYSSRQHEIEPLIDALQRLQEARLHQDTNEAREVLRPLLPFVPEAEDLAHLSELPPEIRLRIFDKLVRSLASVEGPRDKLRRNALALLAGYLATVAAGGAPSLSLAEHHSLEFPEITAWAYLIGGIGETVVWTSSFDGLGRLISRELLRPLRLDEQPTCDFSFDEANALVDPKLSDPLVHLRIKQARLITVALYPGVNISIPVADSSQSPVSRSDLQRRNTVPDMPGVPQEAMNALIQALWPQVQGRIDQYLRNSAGNLRPSNDDKGRPKRKPGSQSQLPLNDPKKFGK